jgi:ADP-heptose:LPS heptosyltransferase
VTRVDLEGAKILVIAYGHVADTMAAVPALRSMRAAYPSASIDVLALESARPILGPCPYIDRLITWRDFQHKGERTARLEKLSVIAALALKLKRSGYDATLVFHRSSGAMRKLAELIGSAVSAGGQGGIESSRDENRRVLEAIGVVEDGGGLELWTSADDAAWAASFLSRHDGPVVGMHPGSDWSCQQWLPERFAEVGRSLQLTAGATIAITGSSGEVELESEIANGLAESPLRAAGRTTFGQFVEVIRRLDLLICVNSAAAAIARAVGTPAIVLMGLEDARYTGIEANRQLTVIQPKTADHGGGWCEFGRWGVLSGCDSPMCRGLGGLAEVAPEVVTAEALERLARGGTVAQRTGTPVWSPGHLPIG